MDTITVLPAAKPKKFVNVLTEWMEEWAVIHSVSRYQKIVLTQDVYALYGKSLADLTAEQLDAACRRADAACNCFPKPADIRAQVAGAETKALALESEQVWESLLNWISTYFHPDLGVQSGAPELAPAVKHACRAAGGFSFLERCSQEQLTWARKTFLSTYRNVRELGQAQHLLSDGAAKRILRQLSDGPRAVRKSISAAPASSSEKPSAGEVREFLKTVSAERPQVNSAASREDLEKNWQSQKERLAARAAELGIPTPPKNISGAEAATR
jgi:hypothetical protein